jgi:prophage regulatory protein
MKTVSTRILRAAELAERLSISRVTLWRWERDGRIPPKRIVGPNVIGWLEGEIEEWMTSLPTAEARGEEIGDSQADAIRLGR